MARSIICVLRRNVLSWEIRWWVLFQYLPELLISLHCSLLYQMCAHDWQSSCSLQSDLIPPSLLSSLEEFSAWREAIVYQGNSSTVLFCQTHDSPPSADVSLLPLPSLSTDFKTLFMFQIWQAFWSSLEDIVTSWFCIFFPSHFLEPF